MALDEAHQWDRLSGDVFQGTGREIECCCHGRLGISGHVELDGTVVECIDGAGVGVVVEVETGGGVGADEDGEGADGREGAEGYESAGAGVNESGDGDEYVVVAAAAAAAAARRAGRSEGESREEGCCRCRRKMAENSPVI